MAQRRPVVVTETGGSPEIVRDGIDGFLVAPGDAAALALRLACLLESPGLRAEMGRRGRLRVERWFTTERMVRATEGVYRAALGRTATLAREATA
jgi:glycosyltransferase involved in cell wall biosynthesis